MDLNMYDMKILSHMFDMGKQEFKKYFILTLLFFISALQHMAPYYGYNLLKTKYHSKNYEKDLISEADFQ